MNGSILDTLSGEKPVKLQIGISPVLAAVLLVFAVATIIKVSLDTRKML